MAAASATAPTTLGLPASSRSGGALHSTESSVTISTVPAPRLPVEVGLVQLAGGLDRCVYHPRRRPVGQIVGVMLHRRYQNHVATWAEWKPPRQLVNRLGRVLAEDAHVCVRVGAHKTQGDGAR